MADQVDDAYIEPRSETSGPKTTLPQRSTETRLGNVEDLTRAILLIAILSLVAIVVAVIGIVIDQMHFNNELYRDGYYNHTKTIVKPASITNITENVTFPKLKTSN